MKQQLLRLLQVPQIGAKRVAQILEKVDLQEFIKFSKEQFLEFGWKENQIKSWFAPNQEIIDKALNWHNGIDQHLVTIFDAQYPFLLKNISNPPPIIFVKGELSSLNLPQIALVGSRDFSDYGKECAEYFSTELVKAGFAITSGLAIGIDGFCHKTALEAGGITIAVLGSGLDNIYPTRHKKLAQEIITKGGVLVSEFFPDESPLALNFPRRNRIISGLSLGTLVVEASLKSGSLITARCALEQGREVFALPNSIFSLYSEGCNHLIKQGANLVTEVSDIVEALEFQIPTTPLIKKHSAPQKSKPLPDLTELQQKIYDYLGNKAVSIDKIAENTGVDVSIILVEMLNLELLGLVKNTTGGYVKN